MNRIVLYGFVLMFFASCEFGKPPKETKPDIFADTVTYTMQAVHERAKDCGNLPDSSCTVVQMSYPLFKGQPALNDSVKNRLLHIFISGDEKADTSLNAMATTLLNGYYTFKKNDERKDMFFTLDTYAKVIKQDSSLIAIEYGGYTYQGGAHGSDFTGFINWNPKTKKEIYLEDVLLPNTQRQLSKIAERIFRKDEKLKDTSSLEQDYFFEDNKFALNENYSFTPLGIRFLYNQYEIKPYAAGQTELFIPWADLKTLIKPGSVAAQYIKKDAGI